MDERKQEIMQWLDKVEQYAVEAKFSSRIIDRIYECRNELCSENAESGKIVCEIEELLKSIEKKALPNASSTDNGERLATLQQMEFQVKKMAERCHDENVQAMDEMEVRKQSVLKKCNMQMKDIVRTDAHAEELKHEARYLQFYEKVAYEYEKESASIISEMLENMNQNYSHMVEHMRSLLHNADNRGAVSEKSLYELETKRDTLGKRLLSELQACNAGKEKILSFAQRTGNHIKKIVKRAELKRKICALMPVLIILGILLWNVISGFLMSPTEVEAANTETGVGDIFEIFEGLKKIFGLQKILSTLNVVGMSSIFVVIAILLIIVILYVVYIKWLRKNCDNSISKKSAEYLEKELLVFEQSGCMQQALEAVIRNASEEYEVRNVKLLNDTFAFADNASQKDKANGLTALIEEWKHMK